MPAFIPLLALAGGIALGGLWPGMALWLAAGASAMCIGAYWRRQYRWAIALLFVVVGIGTVLLHTPAHPDIPDGGVAGTITGRVESVVQSDGKQRVVMKGQEGGVRALVYYHAFLPLIEQGDVIDVTAKWKRPDDGYRVPDEFSIEPYCRAHGISATANCGAGAIKLTGHATNLEERMARWRSNLSHFIFYKTGLQPAAAEMLGALLTGDTRFLSPETRADYAGAGIAHVLALSGMHLAIIAMVIALLLFPMNMGGHCRVALAVTVGLLWLYVAFVGFLPSVVRAAVMASVVAAGRILRRGSRPLNSLCVAGILILVFDPASVLRAGFQLSFVAVACILMFANKFLALAGKRPVMRMCLSWIAVSVSAFVGTALLAAWHFHQIPLMFLVSNLPVVLLMPVFMIAGVVNTVLAACGIDALWLVWILDHTYDVMTRIAVNVANVHGATVSSVYFSAWWLVPYFGVLVLLWLAWERHRMREVLLAGLVVAASLGVVAFGTRSATAPECYAISDFYATTVLLREDGRAWLVTDAPCKYDESLKARTKFRFDEYCSKRGIAGLEVARRLATRHFSVTPEKWETLGTTMVLLNDDYRTESALQQLQSLCRTEKRLVLIVTTGFRGDIVDISRRVGAAQTAISRRLSDARREKLALMLRMAGLVFTVGLEGEIE